MFESARTSRLDCSFYGIGRCISLFATLGARPIAALQAVLNLDVAARRCRTLNKGHIGVPTATKLEERSIIDFRTAQKNEGSPRLLGKFVIFGFVRFVWVFGFNFRPHTRRQGISQGNGRKPEIRQVATRIPEIVAFLLVDVLNVESIEEDAQRASRRLLNR